MVRSLVFVLALAASAPALAAQMSPEPLKVDWQDGLLTQSANGDYRFQLGTVFQSDERSVVGGQASAVDSFLIRKARVVLTARLARYFEFRVVPDFASGAVQLPDAYFDTRFSTRFRVRVGKDKTPVGYELLMADANGWFPERALTSSLVPNRDVGVQAQGDLAGGRVSYAAGVFNGVPDGVSSSADVDTNNGKDVAGRVVFQPARGIGVHVGGSTGRETNGLPAFRTSVGQTYFSYAPGVAADGRRSRIAPAAFFYRSAFGAFAEFARSTQTVARSGTIVDAANSSWQVSASYALTGEAVSDRNLRPRSPFDAANGRWGAVQVLARYSALTVDRRVFASGLAADGASRTADQYTLALNWYPTSFTKWYAAYERTSFDRDPIVVRPPEHAVIVRAQVAF